MQISAPSTGGTASSGRLILQPQARSGRVTSAGSAREWWYKGFKARVWDDPASRPASARKGCSELDSMLQQSVTVRSQAFTGA